MEAAAYPEMMARVYAQSVGAAWVHNSRPVAETVPTIPLAAFQQDVALDPRMGPPPTKPREQSGEHSERTELPTPAR